MFKVGDKVRATRNCFPAEAGKEYTLVLHDDEYTPVIRLQPGGTICGCSSTWQLIESVDSKGTIMAGLKDLYYSITKSEPERSFHKVGITDANDVLTPDGQQIFLSWLLQQNGTAFKTAVVDPILAEQEKK